MRKLRTKSDSEVSLNSKLVRKVREDWLEKIRSFIQKNSSGTDIYKPSGKETFVAVIIGLGISLLIGYLFYQSIIACVILLPAAAYLAREHISDLKEKKKEGLEQQFVDWLVSFSGALKAGYSANRAIPEASAQMELLYGRESLINKEMSRLCTQMEMNRRPEDLFMEFAERSNLEDAVTFAEVFKIITRSGGDMILVVGSTVGMISGKIRTQEDIRTAVRGRRFEQSIMNLMPIAILGYMRVASYEFLSQVYGNMAGILLMTCALILYGLAYFLGRRVVKISV